jgi:hypothetical protein
MLFENFALQLQEIESRLANKPLKNSMATMWGSNKKSMEPEAVVAQMKTQL